MTNLEVMVDLETLSTRSNAIILTIGAIKFNRDDIWSDIIPKNLEEQVIKNPNKFFYRRIDIKSCEKIGLHRDSKTEEWWDIQDIEAKNEALINTDRISIQQALKEFTEWLENVSCMWSHGLSFDIPILEEAYLHCEKEIPWKFWLLRDTRTLYDLGKIYNKNLPIGDKHHALYDCYRQIVGIQKSICNLRK